MPGLYCVISRVLSSNIYVVEISNSELLVIDTGFKPYTEAAVQLMRRYGLEPGNVVSIVNTHCHFDHITGNSVFLRENPGARIAMHELDARFVREGDVETIDPFGVGREYVDTMRVDYELREGVKIRAGDYEFTVLHTPGHTPGSICLFDEDRRVLISGDTVFLEGVGRCDLPYSDCRKLVDSLRKLAELDVEMLLPGHGDIARNNGRRYIVEGLELARYSSL